MQEEDLDRSGLAALQAERLRALLGAVLPGNRFYARKFAEAGVLPADVSTAADLTRLPFTTKEEILADQAAHPPYGEIHSLPRQRYVRLHQTSGTSGRPLRWLDTLESWRWLLGCKEKMFRIIGLRPGDRLFFPFSFGPFLGFWTGFDAATRLGFLCMAGGGMSSAARLRFLLDNEATVVFCTPTYALRLAEVAVEEKIDLPSSPVRCLIVAGEPGGSIPATRARIEEAWGARLYDHTGMTEIGTLGIECTEQPGGLHIMEPDYIAEVIDPATGTCLSPGETGELVLTNLGRWGSPLLRYRTGDLVRVDPKPCRCGRALARLDGGILGRTDDMIHLRGNNIYPSTLEAIIRRFPEVAEFRLEVDRSQALADLRIALEPTETRFGSTLGDRVERAIRDELLFRADVTVVEPGTLPRFEMKAKRLVRRGNAS